jgi:hypothetical protein
MTMQTTTNKRFDSGNFISGPPNSITSQPSDPDTSESNDYQPTTTTDSFTSTGYAHEPAPDDAWSASVLKHVNSRINPGD